MTLSMAMFILAGVLFLVSGIAMARGSLVVVNLYNRRDAGLVMGAAVLFWILSVLAVTWGDAGTPTVDLW